MLRKMGRGSGTPVSHTYNALVDFEVHLVPFASIVLWSIPNDRKGIFHWLIIKVVFIIITFFTLQDLFIHTISFKFWLFCT